MKIKAVSGIMLTVLLTSLAMVSVPVQASPSPVTFAVDMPAQGYISGVSPGTIFGVDILVNASGLTPNSTGGMAGFQIDVSVDPDVLEPLGAIGATSGYFLYDFMKAYYPSGYFCALLIGSIDTTTGYMDEIAEMILPTPPGGAGGTGKLVTLGFKSKSLTAYSPIQISLFQEGEWEANWMDATGTWHDAVTIDGHYNYWLPLAVIEAPTEEYVNEAVTFSGADSYDPDGGLITSYQWDFGDGTSSTEQNPTHTYTSIGTYEETLVVTDDEDQVSDPTTHIIRIKGPVEAIQELIETIETSNLPKGIENSLTSKLQAAYRLLDRGNQNAIIGQLTAFITEVEALRNRKLTDEQGNQLTSEAQRIIDIING